VQPAGDAVRERAARRVPERRKQRLRLRRQRGLEEARRAEPHAERRGPGVVRVFRARAVDRAGREERAADGVRCCSIELVVLGNDEVEMAE